KKCICIDESVFDKIQTYLKSYYLGTPAIVISPPERATSHTVLGPMSACGVINMKFRCL
ncbi:uncharacterized protein EV154DRAFT_422028, partial [Mucor mucedo]|uniref:uncharacterized protein n=1 Tax=Mucor mucedo TaxID=29922 RepID=UPI002220C6A0